MAEKPDAGFSAYYAATRTGGPRKTLLAALAAFAPATGFAVDLGCGTGRDTLELLRRGWRVLAVDAEASAIAELTARPEAMAARERLETRVARFEAVALPDCDLVNSSFALPLCGAEAFPALWQRIRAALDPGGRIACQLFGPRDSWAARSPSPAIHDRAAVQALLAGLAVEMLDEEEVDSLTPRGQKKHWHIFHIVARKP
ncbi:MAG TPA: class I SAM-dependent methyltransferase [Alphaproteobacteria bacterium]